MNKWKAIPVAKAIRVVMKYQGAIALVVVMAVATPDLIHQVAAPPTQIEITTGVDTPIDRSAT
jgi:hypothetical protein